MASYVDYEFYKNLYGKDAMPESDFNRWSWDAGKRVDNITFGKLKFAFPTNEDDAEAVKRCVCELTNFLYQIDQYQRSVLQSIGVVAQADGTVKGKVITSVSSGSESIGYSAGSVSHSTAVTEAAKDKKVCDVACYSMIQSNLKGACDRNGVNLLYAGPYPGKSIEYGR